MARFCGSLVAVLLLLVAPSRAQQACSLIQITSTAGQSIFNLDPAINAGGNRIAFESSADLLGTDASGNLEIFLWDAFTGFVQITNTTGGSNLNPAINAAGNRIAFESDADPLGTNADGNSEIFLWDSSTGLTQITNTMTGTSTSPTINAAGTRIAFASSSDLVGGNADGSSEIFLWDSSTGFTQITSATSGNSFSPAINAAGDRIAFSSSSNLVGTNADGNSEIFLWDSSTGLAQITNTSIFDGNSDLPAINAAGTRIAFDSNANLVGSNGDGNTEIFLWDASTGFSQITNSASAPSLQPAIDATGNRIAFHSGADLLGTNADGNAEIFVWDSATGLIQVTSTMGGNSQSAAINAAGNRIAFHSDANPLGANGDGNNELFLASCQALAITEIPAVSPAGLGALALLLGLAAAWTFRRRQAGLL